MCLESARAILPSVDQERSRLITGSTENRSAQQAAVITSELQSLAKDIQINSIYYSSELKLINLELKKLVKYSPLIDDAILIDKQGNLLTGFPQQDNENQFVGFRSYFLGPKHTGNAYLSEVLITKTQKPVLVLGIPILNPQHEVDRVVALRIDLNNNQIIHSFFKDLNLDGNGYTYIVDKNGHLLFHPNKKRIGQDVKENRVVQELLKGHNGYQQVMNTQGTKMYASYVYIPYLQWGIVAQVPVESTYSSLEAFQKKVWNYAFLFLFPLVLLVALYTQKMIHPIKQLQMAINEVSRGNFNCHILTHGKSEMGILFQRFNEMVVNLQENREYLRQNQQELLEQKNFLRKILDLNPNFIFARNREGKYTLINQAKAEAFGLSIDEILGKSELEVNPNRAIALDFLREDQEVMNCRKEIFIPEQIFFDHRGQRHWIQVHKIPILNGKKEVDQVLCVSTVITERKQKEEEMEFQALHDSLTGLPNRKYLENQVNQLIKSNPDKKLAIMFLDLDRFKLINDSLGHLAGDQLLKEVTKRLQNGLSSNRLIARMGGDEFVILLSNLSEEREAEEVAQSILELLKSLFQIEDREFHITASIGISFYPKDGTVFETLLKYADTAMYQSKKFGKNMYHSFHPAMERSLWERLEMESSLRRALLHEELFLVYQPKMNLQSNQVSGLEALIRWNHPMYGLIPPDKFIPTAEENDLIFYIGEFVLREACTQCKKWQEKGLPPLRMAVNLSVRQLLDPNFLNKVDCILNETRLETQWLEFEITESSIMENAQEVISTLYSLRDKGIHLSIDDFGTGYSSLSYLKQFPIQTIKVDRSFIKDALQDEGDRMIIRAIISMGKSLKLSIIAEGVEEEQQESFLRREGCNEIQGYLISCPLKAEDFECFIRQNLLENV